MKNFVIYTFHSNIIRIFNVCRIRAAAHVARMRKLETHTVLVGKIARNRLIGRPKRRQDNIKIYPIELG
jgi:carbonic anhydrase/acetyltransferase-like protein (isoleucine patch superfamily)